MGLNKKIIFIIMNLRSVYVLCYIKCPIISSVVIYKGKWILRMEISKSGSRSSGMKTEGEGRTLRLAQIIWVM